MPKFPDPTKDYTAKPVGAKSSTSPSPADQPIYQKPPTLPPPQSTPDRKGNPNLKSSTTTPLSPPPISPSPFRKLFPILIGLVAFIILAVLGFSVFPKLFGSKDQAVVLTYWGLWEPSSVMQGVIADYEREHPNIKINYQMQSPKGYRTRLQSAITGGTGPDIARIHNTWLPMLGKSLSPAPDGLISIGDYYPVITNDLVRDGKLYAAPLEIDGLTLYYNIDILAEAGAEPPTDWNSFRKLAFDLTRRSSETGIVERAGAAMGTANNVDHWSDILGLLILQNSGNPSQPESSAVQDALTFYTIFSTTDQSWDASQPSSTYAFASGTLAMMIAPSWQIAEIEAINPTLNFGIAPAPKLSGTDVSWATYWAEAVPISGKNTNEAWNFLAYLSSDETLQKLYTTQSQIRSIGEPYPKPVLASFLATDPLATSFVTQGNSYQSWYLASRTHDEGVNDEFIKYYEDAVNAINDGSGLNSVTSALSAGITQVAGKYNIFQ